MNNYQLRASGPWGREELDMTEATQQAHTVESHSRDVVRLLGTRRERNPFGTSQIKSNSEGIKGAWRQYCVDETRQVRCGAAPEKHLRDDRYYHYSTWASS